MEELRKNRIRFLINTCVHFTSENRGVFTNENGEQSCSYEKGCAIGRHLPKYIGKKLDAGKYMNAVSSDFVMSNLPGKIKKLGASFLRAVQSLHDNAENWDEYGITPTGIFEAKQIFKDIFYKLP